MNTRKRFMWGMMTFLFFQVLLFGGEVVTGNWYYYNDAGDGGSSRVIINGVPTTEFKKQTVSIGGIDTSVSVLTGKVTTAFEYGFIGMGIKLDEKGLAAIKKARGIRFKVQGKNSFRCKLETSNISDYDYFGKNFNAGSSVKTIEVPFSSVAQEGWGESKSFVPGKIVQISFQTVGQPIADVKLQIFDLEFIM